MVVYFWALVILLIIQMFIKTKIFFINDELIINVSLVLFFSLFIYTIRRLFLISLYTEVSMIGFILYFVFSLFLKLINFLIGMSELLFYKVNLQVGVDFMSTILNIHYDFYVFLNNGFLFMFKSWNQVFVSIARRLIAINYKSMFINSCLISQNLFIDTNFFIKNLVKPIHNIYFF